MGNKIGFDVDNLGKVVAECGVDSAFKEIFIDFEPSDKEGVIQPLAYIGLSNGKIRVMVGRIGEDDYDEIININVADLRMLNTG